MACSASSPSNRLVRCTSGLFPNTALTPIPSAIHLHYYYSSPDRLPRPGNTQLAFCTHPPQQAITPCAATSTTLPPQCAVDSDFDTSSCTCPLAGKSPNLISQSLQAYAVFPVLRPNPKADSRQPKELLCCHPSAIVRVPRLLQSS